MTITVMKFLVKALYFALVWFFKILGDAVMLALPYATDDVDPFVVDYPHYTPSADKPGNIAMHDLLHSAN